MVSNFPSSLKRLNSDLYRTLHCPPPQPTACPTTYPSGTGLAWSRLRVAQLQALDEGPDAGEARLSLPRLLREMKILSERRDFWISPLTSTTLTVR